MENKPGARKGPQMFLLSEKNFGELEQVQITLHLMGRIARGDAADEQVSANVTMSRQELYRVFIQLSREIGDALEQVWEENGASDAYRGRQ